MKNDFLRETAEIIHHAGLAWWGVHRVRHLLDAIEEGRDVPEPEFWDVVTSGPDGLRAEGRCGFGSRILLWAREDYSMVLIRTCGGHFVARLEGLGWVTDGWSSQYSWEDAQEDGPSTDWVDRVARRIRRLEAAERAAKE